MSETEYPVIIKNKKEMMKFGFVFTLMGISLGLGISMFINNFGGF